MSPLRSWCQDLAPDSIPTLEKGNTLKLQGVSEIWSVWKAIVWWGSLLLILQTEVQRSHSICLKLFRESGTQMPFVWHLSHSSDTFWVYCAHSPLQKLLPSDTWLWWVSLYSLTITEAEQHILVAVVLSGTLFALGCNTAFRNNIIPFPSFPWDAAGYVVLSGSHCVFGMSSTIQREQTT